MTIEQQVEKEITRLRAVYMADYEAIVIEHQQKFPNLITKEQDDKTRKAYTNTVELRLADLKKTLLKFGNVPPPAILPTNKAGLFEKLSTHIFPQKPSSNIYVGVGVLVVKGNKVVLGMRQGSHCPNQYNLPGGHLEYGEDVTLAACREVLEETDLKINVRMFDNNRADWYVTNNLLPVGNVIRHYLGIFMVADYVSGTLTTKEPMKNKGYAWTNYDLLLHHAKPGDAWLPTEFLLAYREKIGL